MNNELKELLQELLAAFDMDQGAPSTEVWSEGDWHWGLVKSELAEILIQIADKVSEED